MAPRGRGRASTRGRPPSAPATPRSRNQNYVPYNTRPEDIGTRTGLAMPTGVPVNEYGFEDPDEFFKSSPAVNTRSHATPNGRGGHSHTSSSPMPPPSSVRRRPRLSDMNNESDEDGADSLAADGLLDDEYEVDKITPPPLTHQSSPNPPASVAQRSRLPDETPMRLSAARRSTIGVSINPSTPGSSRRANGLHSPFHEVDEEKDDMDIAFDGNELDIQVTEQVETLVVDNGEMPIDEDDDEDSQPVRSRRKSSDWVGPHRPVSSVVEDSFDGLPTDQPMDEDDHSDAGQPFDDDMVPDQGIYADEGSNGLDDEAELEERAVAEESEVAELDEEDDEADKENVPEQQGKRGKKRSATTATLQKRAKPRVSQLPVEGENQFQGDFKMRRSGRTHFQPLRWWMNEHFEYVRGKWGPEIVNPVHLPDEPPRIVVRPRGHRGRGRGRGRSASTRAHSESVAPQEDDQFDIDIGIDTMMHVNDFTTEQIVSRKTFLPRSLITPKPVRGDSFFYQKAFGEDGFIAGGIVDIPPGSEKPSKPSSDNVYIFVVLSGGVQVAIGDSIFPCGTHSSFMVPRGNNYRITNKFKTMARLFFAQGRKVTQGEREKEHDKIRKVQRKKERRQERERDRIVLAEEDFEEKWSGWDSGPEEVDDVYSGRDTAEDLSDGGRDSEPSDLSPAPSSEGDRSVPPTPPPEPAPVKRGPGRPRKNPDAPVTARVMAKPTRGKVTRGRGRGRGRGK